MADLHEQGLIAEQAILGKRVQPGQQHVFVHAPDFLRVPVGRVLAAQHQFARHHLAGAVEDGVEGKEAVAQVFLAHRAGGVFTANLGDHAKAQGLGVDAAALAG